MTDDRYDAFGRSADAPGAPTRTVRAEAGTARASRRAAGSSVAHWAAGVLVLLAGAAGVVLTLDAAVGDAADDPRVAAHALASDPLGPRSLLRAPALRRALDRAVGSAGPDARIERVGVRPQELVATVVDDRDRGHRVSVNTRGDVRDTDLGDRAADSGAPVALLKDVPVQPAAHALAEHWARHRPDARNPTLSLVVTRTTTSTSSSTTTGLDDEELAGALAGLPSRGGGTTTRWSLRWAVAIEGVRAEDRRVLLDAAGRPVR